MKTIKILILSGVFLSTTLSVAQKTWSNNRYTFNNDGGDDKMYLNIDDHTAHAVEFSAGSSIDHISFHAHKVGIGTRSPSEKLEVSGNVKATQFIGDGSRLTNVNASGDFGDTDITTHGIVHIYNRENDALTIQTPDNTQSNGVAFQNSLGNYTWNIFREDVGENYADLVFASGLTTEIADLDERFRITTNGKIGIGTNSPSEKLDVDGNAKAIGIIVTGDGANTNTIDSNIDGTIVFGGEDGSNLSNEDIGNSYYPYFSLWVEEGIVTEDIVIATTNQWAETQPDYVFEADYKLPTLQEVETFINENGHLEGIPSKAEVAEKGWSLPKMDQQLLKKVEELTLYTIEQENQIKTLKKQLSQLETLEVEIKLIKQAIQNGNHK